MTTEDIKIKKEEPEEERREARHAVGTRVRKFFPGSGWFSGQVASFEGEHYHVVYEDGDSEEYDEQEIASILLTEDLEKVQVGCRVAVYRPSEDEYHEAIVTRERIREKPLYLLYANGDREWTDLRNHLFLLLDEKPLRTSRHSRTARGSERRASTERRHSAVDNNDLGLQDDTQASAARPRTAAEVGAAAAVTEMKGNTKSPTPISSTHERHDTTLAADASSSVDSTHIIHVGSHVAVYKPNVDQYWTGIITRERKDKNAIYIKYTKGDRKGNTKGEWINVNQQECSIILLEEATRDRRHRRCRNSNNQGTKGPSDEATRDTVKKMGLSRTVGGHVGSKRATAGEPAAPSAQTGGKNETYATAESDVAKVVVGSRIAIYKHKDDQYHEAIVTCERNDSRPLYLEYTNGDSEWVDLGQRTFVVLEEIALHRGRRRFLTRKEKVSSSRKKRGRTKGGANLDNNVEKPQVDRSKVGEVGSDRGALEEGTRNSGMAQSMQVLDSPKYEIGTKVKKFFKGHGWFQGEVVSCNRYYYRVRYADGDAEDVSESDLSNIVVSSDLANVHVGSRVAVHWPDDGKYYEATVTNEPKDENHLFCLAYEASEESEWLDLREHKFCLLGGVTRRRSDTIVDDSDTDVDLANGLFSDNESSDSDTD